MTTFSPYWWKTAPSLKIDPASLPAEADVVIVGGGYTGLSAALTVARQGKKAVVCDARQPGLGASTRNGGITSGNVYVGYSTLCKTKGVDYANRLYGEGIEARNDLVKFCADENIDCDLQRTGRFVGAITRKDYDALAREAELLSAIPASDSGIEAIAVPKAEQHREIVTDLFQGGVRRLDIGGFHPAKFYAGLLRVCQAAGVTILPDCPVTHLTDAPAGKNVHTARGTLKAGTVIVATNGYTGTEHPVGKFLRRRIVPVQSAIVVTEELGEERIQAMMPGLRMFGDTYNLYSYFRPTPDRKRIMLGSRTRDRHQATETSVTVLRCKLAEIFPDMATVNFDFCWLGNVAFNWNLIPRIFVHDDVYYSAGYAGSGTVWARWLGKKTAERALGLDTPPSTFQGNPPPAIPLYDGHPWFYPAVEKYYMLKDYLKAARR